jgi:hypothetical protein
MHQEQKIEKEPSEEVARWLLDAGRRRFPSRETGAVEAAPPVLDSPPAQRPVIPGVARWSRVALLGLLALAYLQYFFADTLLEIGALRSLIVFAKSLAS